MRKGDETTVAAYMEGLGKGLGFKNEPLTEAEKNALREDPERMRAFNSGEIKGAHGIATSDSHSPEK